VIATAATTRHVAPSQISVLRMLYLLGTFRRRGSLGVAVYL
jgi:hypothetical protein